MRQSLKDSTNSKSATKGERVFYLVFIGLLAVACWIHRGSFVSLFERIISDSH